jgi:2-octaprenyl-6-methoxyphenol hydroxylase
MFDAIVVGGGPVGHFLALVAARQGAKLLLLEAKPAGAGFDDDRSLALSWGSLLLLERAGARQALASGATPILRIHVSQRGGFGRSVLDARDAGVPALGHIVGYGDLQRALAGAVGSVATLRHDTRVDASKAGPDSVAVETAHGDFKARVAIVAEGGGPLVESLGCTQHVKDYGVHAVVARVLSDRAHGNVAYERFTTIGPIALLPRNEGFALVWTLAPDDARRMVAAPDAVFLGQLQRDFGWRAGRFVEVSERGYYPLTLRRTEPRALERIVFLGNAAQTLHPIAGQGLNLGLRDAWAAAKELMEPAPDPTRFARSRVFDRAATIGFTDSLAGIFANDWPGVSMARGVGLSALDLAAPLRRAFARTLTLGPRS